MTSEQTPIGSSDSDQPLAQINFVTLDGSTLDQASSRELATLGKILLAGLLARIDQPDAVNEYVESFLLLAGVPAGLLMAQTVKLLVNVLIGPYAQDDPRFRANVFLMSSAFADSASADRRGPT